MVPVCYLNKGTDGVCLNANQSAVLTKSTSVWFWVNYSDLRSYFPTKCPSHSLSPNMKTTLLMTSERETENYSSPGRLHTNFLVLLEIAGPNSCAFPSYKYFLIDMSSSSWTQFTAPGVQCVTFGSAMYTLEKICTWGQNGTDNCFWGLHRLVHHCILTKC